MKVYRISKWTFLGICLLILALPVSRHWKLLLKGSKATGTVILYGARIEERLNGEKKLIEASKIEFNADGETYYTYGPANLEYREGRTVPVYYDRRDPAVNCVVTLYGFYLNEYTALPLILIMVWYAFYLSFNSYRKRLKIPRGRPARNVDQASLLSRDEEPRSR